MIHLPNEIDLKKLNYTKPIAEKGYYRSIVKYDEGNDELLIQTPPLLIKNIDDTSIELEIIKNKKHENIYKILRSLEELSISNIYNQSPEWFGKQIPIEKIKLMYKSYFFNPETLNGNFIVRFKKHKKLKIYDDDKNEVDINNISIGNNVVCILYINGLLFGKSSSKLDIRIFQMKLIPEPPKLEGCQVDENDSDIEEEDNKEEEDYDSDMDDNYNFEPLVEDTLQEAIPPDTKEEEVVKEEEEKEEDIKISEFELRLNVLRDELKKYSSEGNMDRVEEIACEIIQLKKSK